MRGIFTGMLVLGIVVHYYVHEVYNIAHQSLGIIYCPEWTVLSYHPGVSSCSNGWIKSGHHDVCIYDQSIEDLCITYVIIAGRPTHHWPALPGKLRNGQSPHNQYAISVIFNPGNGNKALEQNDSCIVMSFIQWKKLLF